MKTIRKPLIKLDCPIIDWIDRELGDADQSAIEYYDLNNVLLDLRYHFSNTENRDSLNKLIGGFYQLAPSLDHKFYLLGYRIRQWISLNFSVEISDPLDRTPAEVVPICLTQRSLEELKKEYFEKHGYAVAYHDIRLKISSKTANS